MRKYTVVDIVCRYSRRLWPQLCIHTIQEECTQQDGRTRRLDYGPKRAQPREPPYTDTDWTGGMRVEKWSCKFCIVYTVVAILCAPSPLFVLAAYRVHTLSPSWLIRTIKSGSQAAARRAKPMASIDCCQWRQQCAQFDQPHSSNVSPTNPN